LTAHKDLGVNNTMNTHQKIILKLLFNHIDNIQLGGGAIINIISHDWTNFRIHLLTMLDRNSC